MNAITVSKRLPSPVRLPQSLAWDGASLWMGSLATRCIYRLASDLSVLWETEAPGAPFGMTFVDGELRVLCGETENDNRIIRRCIPGNGFDRTFAIPCPDDTGSQLGYDGRRLHVSQWYNRRVLVLGEDGSVVRSIDAPRGICGQVIVDCIHYLITTENEETDAYFLTRIDTRGAETKVEDIAHVPFPARALAFDGRNFWTNHRAEHQTICFERPD
jgi:hypothetical protein